MKKIAIFIGIIVLLALSGCTINLPISENDYWVDPNHRANARRARCIERAFTHGMLNRDPACQKYYFGE